MYAIIAYVTGINSNVYHQCRHAIPTKKTSVSSTNSLLAPFAVESLLVAHVGIAVKNELNKGNQKITL